MKLIPWYLESRGGTLIDFQFWHLLARLAWTPTLSHFYPTAPEELQPTLALVFKEGDAETLVRTHRMPRERIEIVGNPELDDVARLKTTGLSADERSARLEGFGFDYGKAVVCYLEDGFVEQQQCFGWTEKRRVELMMELANAVTNIGAQLLIRPHPGSNADAMRRAFAGRHGAVVTRDGGLIGAAAVADVVMGTLSTALETPVILGRPILVPLWHIDGDASASPFLRYGVAEAVDHPGMLSHCLSTALKSPPPVDKSTFLRERLGPVDGKSAARVSKAVLGAAVDHIAGAY